MKNIKKSQILLLLLLAFIQSSSAASLFESSEAYNARILNNRRKTILCNLNLAKQQPIGYHHQAACFANTFNFTFLARISDQRLLESDANLKKLADTLSQYSACEINYMKFNEEKQNFEYFTPGESYLWFDGKRLNQTSNPRVYVMKESNRSDGKRAIIYECPLPTSDVYSSLHPQLPRSIQSYPTPDYQVTVSGTHLRLNLLPVENFNINLIKNQNRRLNEEESFEDDFIAGFNWKSTGNRLIDALNLKYSRKMLNVKTLERYLVYYDGRCRKCEYGMPPYESNNNNENHLNPKHSNFVNCLLRANTCEHNGQCFLNREPVHKSPASTSTTGDDDEMTIYNSFICKPEFSQTELFMPCAVENGRCSRDQSCQFNPRTLEVKCL